MGFFTAEKPVTLQPVHPPLGINLNMTHHPLVSLVLKEKAWSLSGDDFTVTDSHGQPVVNCSGKYWTMSGRKAITDAHGNYLFTVRKRLFRLRSTFYGETKDGKELFELKRSMTIKPQMKVRLTNASTGQPVVLIMQGDVFGRSATITIENGPPVAQIRRNVLDARNILLNRQTYFVDVAPGVDLALIAAICICLDEWKNDESSTD